MSTWRQLVPNQPAWFNSTHWSVVLAAGDSKSPRAVEALNQLCQTYWDPLCAFVRCRGYSEHDAQDLTQSFLSQMQQRHAFDKIVPGHTKFRSFLLAAMNHFLSDDYHRRHAQKRGGHKEILSIDGEGSTEHHLLEPRHSETPDKLFERRWAVALIDAALKQLQSEFVAAGKADLFEHLRTCLLEKEESGNYAAVAGRLGMSEEAVKKAAQRMRARYQQAVREKIAETVTTASEIEEELAHLRSVICR